MTKQLKSNFVHVIEKKKTGLQRLRPFYKPPFSDKEVNDIENYLSSRIMKREEISNRPAQIDTSYDRICIKDKLIDATIRCFYKKDKVNQIRLSIYTDSENQKELLSYKSLIDHIKNSIENYQKVNLTSKRIKKMWCEFHGSFFISNTNSY